MTLKTLFTICVLCSSVGFCAGFYIADRKHKTEAPIIITKDVDRPVYKLIQIPKDEDELKAWSETPIVITRKWDNPYYTIKATDGWKESTVTDKITVGETRDWKLTVGFIGGGIILGGAAAWLMFKH